MKLKLRFAFGTTIGLLAAGSAQAQSSGYYPGFYGGLEGGAISYNTQITFDGVDDPAGRGGVGYGAFLGYNHIGGKWLVGAELNSHAASVPNPYTFDPSVVGFRDLDLRRGTSFGLDVRFGSLIGPKVLLYGTLGFSANQQSVRIDGIPLDQITGGAAAETFGAIQLGVGLEIALLSTLGLRAAFRSLSGHDLSATDFGTIPTNASLARFDVEPSQQHFFAGLRFRFRS